MFLIDDPTKKSPTTELGNCRIGCNNINNWRLLLRNLRLYDILMVKTVLSTFYIVKLFYVF
jgi:hypothetical protein